MEEQKDSERLKKISREETRKEISELSFEELEKFKQKIGLKLYKEIMFDKTSNEEPKVMKRKNKNRPREMSSKIPTPVISYNDTTKRKVSRDPRFDPLCGEFDKDEFKKSYKFIDEFVQNDLNNLKKQLQVCVDPEEAEKLKYLIQRIENKQREEGRLKKIKEKKKEERERTLQMMKEGKKPDFLKKSEKRVLDLVDQFSELKQTGRLEKHIERKRKKITQKERKNNIGLAREQL